MAFHIHRLRYITITLYRSSLELRGISTTWRMGQDFGRSGGRTLTASRRSPAGQDPADWPPGTGEERTSHPGCWREKNCQRIQILERVYPPHGVRVAVVAWPGSHIVARCKAARISHRETDGGRGSSSDPCSGPRTTGAGGGSGCSGCRRSSTTACGSGSGGCCSSAQIVQSNASSDAQAGQSQVAESARSCTGTRLLPHGRQLDGHQSGEGNGDRNAGRWAQWGRRSSWRLWLGLILVLLWRRWWWWSRSRLWLWFLLRLRCGRCGPGLHILPGGEQSQQLVLGHVRAGGGRQVAETEAGTAPGSVERTDGMGRGTEERPLRSGRCGTVQELAAGHVQDQEQEAVDATRITSHC